MILRRKPVILLGVITLVVALLALVYLFRSPPDPLYAGIPLSEHLYRFYLPPRSPWGPPGRPLTTQELEEFRRHERRRQASYAALTNLGPESLPLLKHWLTTQHPAWMSNFQVRMVPYFPRITANRRQIALSLLANFPVKGNEDLFPWVADLMTNTNAVDLRIATAALARIASSGKNLDVQAVLRILLPLSFTMKEEQFSFMAGGYYFSNVKHNVDRAIVAIDPQRIFHPLVVLELGPLPNRVGAARELAESPRLPEQAVPLLVSNLNSTNRSVQEYCAIALGHYQASARPALPALSNLLAHPRERIRVAASNAISKINAPHSMTNR